MATRLSSMAIRAQALSEQITQWRRRIHANPELSYQEYQTSQFVVEILKNIPGMQVQTGIGYPTAVVGTLTSGHGPVIAIRADMDALPIRENTNHHFRSRNDGVMHAVMMPIPRSSWVLRIYWRKAFRTKKFREQ